MKIRIEKPDFLRSNRGSILVICMVLAALGTLGISAWISLLDARSHQAEASLSALKRRAVLDNSKALAYRALYANHLHKDSALTVNTTYTLPDDLGKAVIRTYGDVPLSQSGTLAQTKNGGVPFRSYSRPVTVNLTDGKSTINWEYQLRSYNPVLGGELLSVFPPRNHTDGDPLLSGSINVKGRATIWDGIAKDLQGGIRADEFVLPNDIGGTVTLSDTAGNAILPLNYPIPVQTTGLFASSSAYSGELDIFRSANNPHNDYYRRMNTSIGRQYIPAAQANTPVAVGPGPSTVADKTFDTFLENEIQTKDPATLMTTLPGYYPLSSRILNAVTAKNNPAFSTQQIFTIFDAHTPIPNDALANLVSTARPDLDTIMEELNVNNRTAYVNQGNGSYWIFMDVYEVPNLHVEAATQIVLVGQKSAVQKGSAASLPPLTILATRTNSDTMLAKVRLLNENSRRFVLGLSSEGTTPQSGNVSFEFLAPTIPFPKWNMILEANGMPLTIDMSTISNATIRGGIRTNAKMNAISGTLTLERETNYADLEEATSRTGWVEAYRK